MDLDKKIDRIILYRRDAITLFEDVLADFDPDDMTLFLKRVVQRTEEKTLKRFIKHNTVRDNGYSKEFTYIYGDRDITVDDPRIQSAFESDDESKFDNLAHQNWLHRRLIEINHIRKRASYYYNIDLQVRRVGLDWKGKTSVLKRLYTRLLRENYLDVSTSEELFTDVFLKNRSIEGDAVHWLQEKRTLAYFLYLLKETKLLGPTKYNAQISQYHLFNYNRTEKVSDILNEVSAIKNDEISIKSKIYTDIKKIVDSSI